MSTVLSLLRSRNRCLERIHARTDALLRSGQPAAGLPALEKAREDALKAVALFDRKMTELVPLIDPSARDAELSRRVKEQLDRRETLLAAIVSTDSRLAAWIEQEKDRLQAELSGSRRSREAIGKFKSQWIAENGEELDSKL